MKRVAVVLGLMLAATAAHAHSWYPMECCSELDCAPVDNVEMVPGGRNMTTKHGTVFVPDSYRTYSYKNSKGEDVDFEIPAKEPVRLHVCMAPTYPGVGMRLLCLFQEAGI